MAETLKSKYGTEVPKKIANMVSATWTNFDQRKFLSLALRNYDSLELMPRARQIAAALGETLPKDFNKAAKILIGSLGPKLSTTGSWGMAPFIYLPHVFYVSSFGLECFEGSMELQYEITQRFSAEFSLRYFIERYPEKSLKKLKLWCKDPSVHVRRLVSEGTRTRLPWAPRLKCFQDDPSPIFPLLKSLRDDPELYVRRSVANNLNDIGKDNPDLLYKTIEKWRTESWKHADWITRHALRSAVKRAEPGALKLLGIEGKPKVKIQQLRLSSEVIKIGDKLEITFDLVSTKKNKQLLEVDLAVHFVKASGLTTAKIFKLKNLTLSPSARESLRKSISFAKMTTRKLYPGVHKLELKINGVGYMLAEVTVRK